MELELLEQAKIKLQKSLYKLKNNLSFYGCTLQMLEINFTETVPTLGISLDKASMEWKLAINPDFFVNKLTDSNRIAVLIHELEHLTRGHTVRVPFMSLSNNDRILMNLAGDLSINQHITHYIRVDQFTKIVEIEYELPKDCVSLDNLLIEGKKMSPNLTMEDYYSQLKKAIDENKEVTFNGKDITKGDDASSSINKTQGQHLWEESSSTNETEVLKSVEQLFERVKQKNNLTYDQIPGQLKDFLTYSAKRKAELNYKQLVKQCIRRSLSKDGVRYTWNRPNRYWGGLAKGEDNPKTPELSTYIDTSGSISVKEVEDLLSVVNSFLKTTSAKCQVSMFNTVVYDTKVYKKRAVVGANKVQSGGTDLKEVLQLILKQNKDLNIVLTDGYYDNIYYESWLKHNQKFPNTIFVITSDGTEDHPLKRLGRTIKIPRG